MTPPPDRTTMNGKPVLSRPAKTVLNMESGFKDKLLCDGPTFSLGDACAYSCSFCYVPDMMRKAAYVPHDQPHESLVIRRENALQILHDQLTVRAKGGVRKPKYDNHNDNRVVYSSPLVDCAANMDLVRETVEACALILELTHWHIRLLSKSNLLPHIARGLVIEANNRKTFTVDDTVTRVIYGVSTGTLDDKLAAAFEEGCPKVSKRIESLHWLQDNGFRTFGMICPSLPQKNGYAPFAIDMANALRIEKCEHVWAEVINVRGASMTKTVRALRVAGYEWEATELERISADPSAWELYARLTFGAHASRSYRPGQLRFLQYVTASSASWWRQQQTLGAVLLGSKSQLPSS